MTTIYGIKNCDTMKKAFNWLDENAYPYVFFDYKKQGLDEAVLKKALDKHGWEVVINKRGTTWRALDDEAKDAMNNENALKIAAQNPSILKRPMLVHGDTILIGFSPALYQEVLA